MTRKTLKIACAAAATVLSISSFSSTVWATNSVTSVLPAAGINCTLNSNATSLSNLQTESEKMNTATVSEQNADTVKLDENVGVLGENRDLSTPNVALDGLTASAADSNSTEVEAVVTNNSGKKIEDTVIVSKGYTEDLAEAAETNEEEGFDKLVIAQVNDYVNVRSIPSEEGDILGKLYDDSVGTFIEEVDGWYKISSGSVEGYVKGEYCVTGEAAVDLAKQVGTRIATVTTTTLKVRELPGLDTTVLGLVPIEDQLEVTEELDGWVKVNIEEGDGYVSTDYVTLSTEFVKAESKEEEEARLAKEAAEREAARRAAASNTKTGSFENNKYKDAGVYMSGGSATGKAVADFACQFVGNPYVYGGTSLTNGADCSGFVMSVYNNFGVSLPHSSAADRNVGATVGSLAEAQPGDIVCYSGHVAIYIGNGQIVHASTSKTGIIISSASYRNILSIRRIF